MSSDPVVTATADLPHMEAQRLGTLLSPAGPGMPGGSYRYVAEPCSKHAKDPPGEQSWGEGDPDPVTGLPPKKRDPNGFVHGCPECEANATVIKEG